MTISVFFVLDNALFHINTISGPGGVGCIELNWSLHIQGHYTLVFKGFIHADIAPIPYNIINTNNL